LLVPGGVPCFSPPRFSFFPFSRVVGGNALRAKRQEQNKHGNKKTESAKMVEIGRFQIQTL